MSWQVKIMAVSDIHGCVPCDKIADMAIKRRADILVIAGDLQTAYAAESPRDYFHEEFLRSVRRLMDSRCIEVILVPGNHDSYIHDLLDENRKASFAGNLHILQDSEIVVDGVRFYGTPWVPPITGDWCYEESEERMADIFSKIPSDIDVLIAHSPPLGISDDELWDVSTDFLIGGPTRHFGSGALREAIINRHPKCVVCGHIHSGDHGLNRIGDTAVLNCSLIDERYKEAYLPSDVAFDKEGVRFRTNGGKKWKRLTCMG